MIDRLKQRLLSAFEYTWDNPTAEHDARNILSSPKVGMWLGAEGVLIAGFCALAFFLFPSEEREFRRLLSGMGSGRYLVTAALFTLTCFVTLVVPLRASGLLEGPRWRGYLDQLITTGMSPMRYYAGKWATSQPFFAALLGASLPFVVLFGLLGGADWGWVLLAYALLYLYCNLLLAMACGLGALLHEVPALLLTWAIFVFAGIVAMTPAPSALAVLSPVRLLVQPMVAPLAGADASLFGSLYGAAQVLGLTVPWPLYAGGVWLLLIALLAATCLLGPLHAFVPGLNNFGAVVLPGDRKKFFLRRFRPFVVRRVELAFLFENRSPRLARWALPLRCAQQLVGLTLLIAALFGFLFHPDLVGNTPLSGLLGIHLTFCSIVLLVALFTFSTGRVQSLATFDVGPLRLPIVLVDALMFVIVLALLVCAHVLGFSSSWEDLGLARTFRRGIQSPDELFRLASASLAVLLAVACSAFLVSKVIGSSVLGKGWVFFGTAGYVFGIYVLPAIALALSEGFARAETEGLRNLSTPMFVLGQISPGTQMMVILEGVPRRVPHPDLWVVQHGFWLWHPLLIGYLLLMVRYTHGSLFEEAELLDAEDARDRVVSEGLRPPESPQERVLGSLRDPQRLAPRDAVRRCPCEACGSFLAVPLRWTWWGGRLAMMRLDYLRCLDCRREYRASTGTPSHFTVFVTTVTRFLLVGLLAFGGAALLVAVST